MAAGQRSSRPGPRRLPAEVVAFEQRERLMAAMATCVAARGYERTTITDVVTTAAIARQTFYEHYADKAACFIATYDALDQHLRVLVEKAYGGEEEWPDKVAAALTAMVAFFVESPEAARVLLVESAALGEAIRPRLDQSLEWLEALLRGDAAEVGEGLAAPIEEPIVIGTAAMLAGRLDAGQSDLGPLAADLIESALGPYIGFERAREVAARHAAPTD